MTIDTPSLTFFDYHDYVPQDYLLVNFNSLVEAKLSLIRTTHIILGYPTSLIKELRNVEILHLSSLGTLKTIYYYKEAIPFCLKSYIIYLLQLSLTLQKNSPMLETLVIKGPLHYDENEQEPDSDSEHLSGYSCLRSCPVKVLKIILNTETILELDQLKHFLEKLPCLELVKVCYRTTYRRERLQLIKDLLNLPRSSKCKIQFEFIPS